MPSGVQTWNPQGQITLDTNDSISKIIGTITTQQGVAGSVTVPEFAGGTRIFIFRYAQPLIGGSPPAIARCEVSVSGRTINWTAGRGPVVFSYGVY